MQVDTCKKLEETMHLHVRHLCQDSTFDLFELLSIFFPKSELLNLGCGFSASAAYTPMFTVVFGLNEAWPWRG